MSGDARVDDLVVGPDGEVGEADKPRETGIIMDLRDRPRKRQRMTGQEPPKTPSWRGSIINPSWCAGCGGARSANIYAPLSILMTRKRARGNPGRRGRVYARLSVVQGSRQPLVGLAHTSFYLAQARPSARNLARLNRQDILARQANRCDSGCC